MLLLQVQGRIEGAVQSEDMGSERGRVAVTEDISVLRGLFCEGNELGMNNYEGMLEIQQVIQRKVSTTLVHFSCVDLQLCGCTVIMLCLLCCWMCWYLVMLVATGACMAAIDYHWCACLPAYYITRI